jgi:hypothetical protein
MRSVFILLGVMMLAAGLVRAAAAQDASVGVAVYIEVAPTSVDTAVALACDH